MASRLAFYLWIMCGSSGCAPVTPPSPVQRVSCDKACLHVTKLLGGPSFGTCMGICQPIQDPKFALCVNAAKTTADINNCDR